MSDDLAHYAGSIPINVEFFQTFGHPVVFIRRSGDAHWARCECGEQMTTRADADAARRDAVAHLEHATGREFGDWT